jgi:peptidyl-prolyl cis-trans isomerase D
MFEAVRKNQRISQVILAIIIVPFAFFGMDAFFDGSQGSGEVASVGDAVISVREFEQALQERQERIRQASGGEYDRALYESEAFRRSVLDGIIDQRVLAVHAVESRMSVSPEQLQEVITGISAFQDEGRFSLERYEQMLRAQGMTPAMFEAQLARDLESRQISEAVGESAFVGDLPARRLLQAQLEEREIRELQFKIEPLKQEVVLEEGAARDYYEANPARFERAPRLRAEYLVFDAEALRKKVTVTDEEIEAYYKKSGDRFGQPEERKARHILIEVAADAADDVVAQAQAKAEGILAALRASPERFEELAKKESQDPGSAPAGGDLGYFGPGAMVKPFEEAAYALTVGQISDLVRTDFGFHIIELTAIKEASIKPLDEVREEIAEELSRQEASRQFAMQAEKFANTVYEQPDSLKPAAEMLGLEIQKTDWISRQGGQIGGYSNDKLLDALFSEDVRANGENAEAVEVERGVMVSARVTEYEGAQTLPFEDVRASIEDQLRAEAAAQRAREQGEAVLAAVSSGQAPEGEWSAPRTVQRAKPTMSPDAMKAVFGVSSKALPGYVGVTMPGGDYSVFEVVSVKQAELADDDPRLAAVGEQYTRWMAEREFRAYIESLRERYKVQINAAALRSGIAQ